MYLFWEQKGKNERTKKKGDKTRWSAIYIHFTSVSSPKKKVSHSSTIILIELTISTGKSAR